MAAGREHGWQRAGDIEGEKAGVRNEPVPLWTRDAGTSQEALWIR